MALFLFIVTGTGKQTLEKDGRIFIQDMSVFFIPSIPAITCKKMPVQKGKLAVQYGTLKSSGKVIHDKEINEKTEERAGEGYTQFFGSITVKQAPFPGLLSTAIRP